VTNVTREKNAPAKRSLPHGQVLLLPNERWLGQTQYVYEAVIELFSRRVLVSSLCQLL